MQPRLRSRLTRVGQSWVRLLRGRRSAPGGSRQADSARRRARPEKEGRFGSPCMPRCSTHTAADRLTLARSIPTATAAPVALGGRERAPALLACSYPVLCRRGEVAGFGQRQWV